MARTALLTTLLSFALVFLALGHRSELAEAGTAVQLELEQRVDRAELVLEARVLSAAVLEDGAGQIQTELVLEVERTFLGEDLSLRTVTVPGGVLPDGRGLLLAGAPRLVPGEEAILFLTAESPNGWRMPVGLAQGVLRIHESGGAKVLVASHGGLALVEPGTLEVQEGSGHEVLDYAETVARIHAAVAERASGEGGE